MKNPYNPDTAPASFKHFQDTHIKYIPIEDNNSNFELIKIKKTPHCIKHGAMNKVSSYPTGGYWRCLQGLCRAGCEQINPII